MAQQLVKLRRKKRMSSSPQTQSSSSTPTHRHPNLSAPSMLERTLSSRRVNSYADDDADADVDADESKTKKNQHHSKSKRLLKSLLSRRKSKKDDLLYTYLDEY